MGINLANMSLVANMVEDYEASARYAERALEMFQAIGNDYQQPFPHRMLAYAALHKGDLQEARIQAMESLRGNYALGHKTGMLAALLALAGVELRDGNEDRARSLVSVVMEESSKRDGLQFMVPDRRFLEGLMRSLGTTSRKKPRVSSMSALLLEYGIVLA